MMSFHQRAGHFPQRSDNDEAGTTAAAQGVLRKRDRQGGVKEEFASLQGALRKGTEERRMKKDKRKHKTPRASEPSGPGSKHDPLVID